MLYCACARGGVSIKAKENSKTDTAHNEYCKGLVHALQYNEHCTIAQKAHYIKYYMLHYYNYCAINKAL